jgi:hypothetical protein
MRRTPEKQAVDKLRSTWPEIQPTGVKILEDFFNQLCVLDEQIAILSPNELHESLWGIFGLISRCYQLMLCSISQVETKNLNGFYVAARGLVETLCSIVWVSEKPERLCNLVQDNSLRIGAILNAGYRKYPGLKDVYSRMSDVAHPNRTSHLLGLRTDVERRTMGAFGPFSMDFSIHFAEVMIHDLASIGQMIIAELQALISKGEQVIRGGRIMVKVEYRERDTA